MLIGLGANKRLLLALSKADVARLMAGLTIAIPKSAAVAQEMVLAYSETEEELHLRIAQRGMIGPDTKVELQ